MKIFDSAALSAGGTKKYSSALETVLLVLTFAVTPVCGVILITSGEWSALYASLSGFAWRNGLMLEVCLWSALNVANFSLALKMNVDAEGLRKPYKIAFLAVTVLAIAFLTATMCVPYLDDGGDPEILRLRQIHNNIAPIGFGIMVLETVAIMSLSMARSKTQCFVSAAVMGLFIASSVFMLVEVKHPDSFMKISSIAQVYVFCAMNVCLAVEYFLTKLIPASRSAD